MINLNYLLRSAPIQTTVKRALLAKTKTSALVKTILYGQNWAAQPPRIPLSQRFEGAKQGINTILYGQNGAAQKQVPASKSESAYEMAVRFSYDTNSSRLEKILPQLTEEQRFDFAKEAVKKTSGITDCCSFVRYKLDKYNLSEENRRTLLQELDSKSRGNASIVAKQH